MVSVLRRSVKLNSRNSRSKFVILIELQQISVADIGDFIGRCGGALLCGLARLRSVPVRIICSS